MKMFTMFSFDFLFNDFFAKSSNESKLLYIKLNFFANNGFVSNALSICEEMGYDKSILQELINAGELLTLPTRSEVFITSYFLHNCKLNPYSFLKTPYAVYWKDKLFVKKNGVATFKPQNLQSKNENDPEENSKEFNDLLKELEDIKE